MAIDKSEILREFPFNCLYLPNDETVILTDDNWAIHRSNLQAVLISNKALYLGWTWQDRAKWRRFPMTEIECATLISGEYSVAFKETTLLIGLLVVGLWLLIFAKWGITALGGYLLFYGALTLGFIAWGVWQEIRSQHATCTLRVEHTACALRVEMGKKNYTWRMSGDDAVERAYDCSIVRSILDKLAELGVKTATEL